MIKNILGVALMGVLVSGANLGLSKINTHFEQKRRCREVLSALRLQIIELLKHLEKISSPKDSVLTRAIQLKELNALIQKCLVFVREHEENGSKEYTPDNELWFLPDLSEALSDYNNANSNEGELRIFLLLLEKLIADSIRKLDSELSHFHKHGGWILSYLSFG